MKGFIQLKQQLGDIQFQLECYQKSIYLLTGIDKGNIDVRSCGVDDRHLRYRRTHEDKARLKSTLANIEERILELEIEQAFIEDKIKKMRVEHA